MANTPSTAAPAAAGTAGKSQATAPSAPFRAGTFETVNSDGYAQTTTLGASQAQLPIYNPSPNNFLSGLYLTASAAAASNTATVAFEGDGPWIVYQSITFQDANGVFIVGPVSGYQLMVVNKFGGYANSSDPRADATYSVTTGSGSTGGSFYFTLYLPLQVDSRDTLGTLQNQSTNSAFQLSIVVNAESAVYSTSPTDAPVLTTTIYEDGYAMPSATTSPTGGSTVASTPPQLGTTQRWVVNNMNGLNGQQTVPVTGSLGFPVRNFVLINYDVSAATRAAGDTDFPTSSTLNWKGNFVFTGLNKTLWKSRMSKFYGLTSATADTANGLENAVYTIPMIGDFSNAPGDETRNSYWVTSVGDLLQYIGQFNGNSNLQWLTNLVAPVAGSQNIDSIRAGARS